MSHDQGAASSAAFCTWTVAAMGSGSGGGWGGNGGGASAAAGVVATALALGALILTFGPVSGAHFRRGVQKNLQLRIRKDHGANVAPLHHHSSASTRTLLLGHQHMAHAGNRRQSRSCLRHFPSANRIGDVCSVQKDIVL